MSRRTRDGGVVFLNQTKIEAKRKINNFLETGQYGLVANPCLCGSAEKTILSNKDRYGFSLKFFICNKCGIIRIDPFLDEESYRDFYEKYYRTFYFSSPTPKETFFKGEQNKRAKRFIDVIRSIGIENNIKRMFDVGAGEGGMVAAFQELMGYEVAGCELNPNYVEWAQKEKNLDISLGTLDELSIEESSYDAVILCHVLEHMRHPDKEINSMLRIIRPGGYLILEVPGIYNYTKWSIGKKLQGYLHLGHIWSFSATNLKAYLEKFSMTTIYEDESVLLILKKNVEQQMRTIEPVYDVNRIKKFINRRMFLERFVPSQYYIKNTFVSILEGLNLKKPLKKLFQIK